jgi:hypothetical protein
MEGKQKKTLSVTESAVLEWLKSINLQEYIGQFLEKGYDDLEFIKVSIIEYPCQFTRKLP